MPIRLRPLSRDEVRGVDAQAADDLGMPTLILMENAGRGAAELLHERTNQVLSRVLILCGPGNNGGDGGVVARHLDALGYCVQVVWFADPARLHGDAATQWTILERSGINQSSWQDNPSTNAERLDKLFAQTDWLVDGLLGTGLTRPVEGVLLTAIEALNRSGQPVLALDLPSGLDANLGQPLGAAVRARVTATFFARKLGFLAPEAAEYLGEVVVVDLGVPRRLLEPYRG